MKSFKDKKGLIVGLGLSGKAMNRFLASRGAIIFGYDDKYSKEKEEGMLGPVLTEIDDALLHSLDFLAVSPGVPESHPLYLRARKSNIPIFGEMELGAKEFKNRCIGITGTNGKSTTCSLIAYILNYSGQKAKAIGNIGLPITSEIDQLQDEIVILELSSYQIDSLKTPFLDIGVILNITEDHLDRYHTFENYAYSKLRLKNFIKKNGSYYVKDDLPERYPDFFAGYPTMVYREKGYPSKFKVPENIEPGNFSIAYLICKKLGVEDTVMQKALSEFQALEHRREFVANINGIEFYNDSKATNLDSVCRGVLSFKKSLTLIMGGEDKGFDFSVCAPFFKDRVKYIFTIGQTKEKIKRELGKDIIIKTCASLKQAVRLSYENSKLGDIVLLAPGCSSFDMFNNFEHRGCEFKRLVKLLKGEKS